MPKKKTDKRTFDSPEDFDEFMSGKEGNEEDFLPPEEEEVEAPKEAPPPVAPPKAAKEVALPDIEDDEKPGGFLDVAADVPVQVVAVMGKKNVTVKEIATLRLGEVLELGRPANEVVDLVAGGKLIAKGELVDIEGKLGVRIVKMIR